MGVATPVQLTDDERVTLETWVLARHPSVYLHYTPTHASWLNQVEVWFSILTQAVLRGLSATDPHQVRQAIDRFTDARNEHPVPFEWTKTVVASRWPQTTLR